MNPESARNASISDIFYYFEQHTNISTGRAVGRKIGTLQEIIVRKFLMQSQLLTDAIVFEPFLLGYSGTGHKVEFVFFQPIEQIDLAIGESKQIGDLTFTLQSCDLENLRAKYKVIEAGRPVTTNSRLHYGPTHSRIFNYFKASSTLLKLSKLTHDGARFAVLDTSNVRASVESKRVGAQRFSNSDMLGSGIQTIEKAKQAALVAIDADLKFNGTIKALSPEGARRNYVSVAVLGNGVHWTDKDKNILRTFIDYTYLVSDDSIIRYAEYVRSLAAIQNAPFLPFFMEYFQGMIKTAADSFSVTTDDFKIVCPEDETRSLLDVLETQLIT